MKHADGQYPLYAHFWSVSASNLTRAVIIIPTSLTVSRYSDTPLC